MNPNEYVASYLLAIWCCLALLIVIAEEKNTHQTDDGNNKIKVTIQLSDYGQMIRYSEHTKLGDYHKLFTVLLQVEMLLHLNPIFSALQVVEVSTPTNLVLLFWLLFFSAINFNENGNKLICEMDKPIIDFQP